MGVLVLLFAVFVSLLLLFVLTLKYRQKQQPPTDVLDLESLPQQREKQVLSREDSEDLIV